MELLKITDYVNILKGVKKRVNEHIDIWEAFSDN